jgi:signal transduction histidine kinase
VFSIKEATNRNGLDLERPISRVDRNIRRCDRIISVLLDYTRNREAHCTPVAIDGWINDVLNEQQIPQGIRLVRKLGASNCTLPIDVEQMRRAVVNLFENSVQAFADLAQDSNERRITISTRLTGDRCELAVEDTGPGIPQEVLPRVFEPLFSTRSFGTGLGLPIVKRIVDQHGGTIEISSEPAKGTRAVINLPLAGVQQLAA